ncbi:hypothetical protein Droror1_Dr00024588 [Drosera rotundifolia]
MGLRQMIRDAGWDGEAAVSCTRKASKESLMLDEAAGLWVQETTRAKSLMRLYGFDKQIGVDAAREDGYRLYWSVGASWGLGKLVEADFSCEFLKKYPKVDWGLHYGFGMSSVAVVL